MGTSEADRRASRTRVALERRPPRGHVPAMSSRQANLFEDPAPGPPGFVYRPDLISPDEQVALARAIGRLELRAFEMQGSLARRRVASFGRRYDGLARGLEDGPPIPDFLQNLRRQAADLAGLAPEA